MLVNSEFENERSGGQLLLVSSPEDLEMALWERNCVIA